MTGARGLLGTDLVEVGRLRGYEVRALGRSELDVTDVHAVRRVLGDARPDVVVQCAAYTAVDRAEAEPALAMAVNRDGTASVAAVAEEHGARLVFVSTDYVFDGGREEPYPPGAETHPLSTYGWSKLAGEQAALEGCSRALVARVSWLYGHARPTFITSMLRKAMAGEALRVVDDEVGGPSWTRTVSATLLDLVDAEVTGVWHASDSGQCSRFQLVREGLRVLGLDADVSPVPASTWPAPAKRPAYSVLDVSATEETIGRSVPHWSESVAAFLRAYPVLPEPAS